MFLAMRFVAGDDLGTVVARDGPLAPERAARILMQVASALEAVHERGLVHRDVKPANVLLGPDDQAFLTDFGVAKQPFADGHTAAGALVGTPDYVAPEQIRGEPLGPHTDVYALGGLLFFTLTGHVAFPLEHTEGKLWAHLREPPPVAPAFDAIVRTALAKDPRERYPSAAAFEQALARRRSRRGRRPRRSGPTHLAGSGVRPHRAGAAARARADDEHARDLSVQRARDVRVRRRELLLRARAVVVAELRRAARRRAAARDRRRFRQRQVLAVARRAAAGARGGVLPGSERWRQVAVAPGRASLASSNGRRRGRAASCWPSTSSRRRSPRAADEAERAAFVAALVALAATDRA